MPTRKLADYRRKRRFDATPEPSGAPARSARPAPAARAAPAALRFVVQEHHARHLHYDFRLELDGVLKSWAIPKGPSLDPSVKRLAVQVEDHPLDYGAFEGDIPAGHYGAGSVRIDDAGHWIPDGGQAGARRGYRDGKLTFALEGGTLHGRWSLVRTRSIGHGKQASWLLIKARDEAASEVPGSANKVKRRAKASSSAAKSKAAHVTPGTTAKTNRRAKASPSAATSEAVRAAPGTTAKANRSAKVSSNATPSEAVHATPGTTAKAKRHAKPSPNTAPAGRRAALPERLTPQLATLVDAPPPGDDWRYEMKFDGYRVLIRIAGSGRRRSVQIYTREGNDWSAKFHTQCEALAALPVRNAWFDGEAVVADPNGVPSFAALQQALSSGDDGAITLFLFDVPHLDGRALQDLPLDARRALLAQRLGEAASPHLRLSPTLDGEPAELLAAAAEAGLEGLIGKRGGSRYRAGRGDAWIKLKCRQRQEFVIGGYTDPQGSREGLGALLLGVFDVPGERKSTAKLRYAGRVGTGFDRRQLASLVRQLQAVERARTPFATPPKPRGGGAVHWVAPTLVAECEFANWTADGLVRQAAFVALRDDKPASRIVRETPAPAPTPAPRAPGKPPSATPPDRRTMTKQRNDADLHGVRITHPERVIDADSGATKLDLVRYYAALAPWLLPQLHGRPVSLVRYMKGVGGPSFFQKHAGRQGMTFVTRHPGLDPGHDALITLDDATALIHAAQFDTIEFHTWNASIDRIERPDRLVFDLDPDPSLPWRAMTDAAGLVRALLDELGLESFCKTSGGKGLHVVAPISRHTSWDDARDFSQDVARHLAATLPERFTATMGPKHRKGLIFVDYLRNGRGASTVAAYSARARPGLGVSVPLAWDEVPATRGGAQWTIANVAARLAALERDPWDGYGDVRQRLTAAMRKRLAPGSG
ncbi:DNA ligase D [Burkholderia sp. 22PA0106]|uniref:DNA ligase D n=1 Tax=Burkholderia sp. 22PA0106 TaxID=3237371 RepID=UPI0039C20A36